MPAEGATMDDKTITTASNDPATPSTTSACVVQIYGGELGKRYPIADEVTIGRGDLNTIVLDLPNVSRNHARIFVDRGACYVEDLGSTNGTTVNEREVETREALANGDLVTTGGAVFKFIAGGNIEALYHEEIYRLTILDGLTAVHNKRYLFEFLERELARASRYGRLLAVAMIDFDHFKVLNDTYGHLAGDHVLKRVAQLMEGQIRREELLARYGGEEFVIVLPETDGAGAAMFCERMRSLVESHQYEFDGHAIPVTVSIGVAALRDGLDVTRLLALADAALYRAKHDGRNRVALAAQSD